MAITNFQFPGVELRQEFVQTPVTGVSQLGVVIVGPKHKSNTYKGWEFDGSASTIDFSAVAHCTLDDASSDELTVTILDGLFKDFEATSSSTGLTITPASSPIADDKHSATVVFSEAVTGSTVFGTLKPAIGDTVDIKGSGSTAVPGIITKITGATVNVETTGSTVAGTTVTAMSFYKIADGVVTGLTAVDGEISMPASITAMIGGQTTSSTLQAGIYNVRASYDGTTSKFELNSVGSNSEILDACGEVVKDNDMANALAIALAASRTNIVYYLAVKEDSEAGYMEAMDFLDKFDYVYSVVPLTYDTYSIKQCITSAVSASEDYESKVRRTVWYGLETTGETSAAIVTALKDKRAEIGQSYRAQAVWADTPVYNGYEIPNYVLAAAPAGMRSYEPTYRPISNLGYTFFNVFDSNGLTNSQLKDLGANGVWIIDNNFEGTPINKKQVTTAVANNLNLDEESIVANADSIALSLCHVGENVVGNSNISPLLLKVLKDTITNIMENYLINTTGNAYVGPQLLSWSLDSLYQHATMLDHIYAVITCEPPKPFNRFVMTLRIV